MAYIEANLAVSRIEAVFSALDFRGICERNAARKQNQNHSVLDHINLLSIDLILSRN
jgi:hypothetical protein